MLMNLAKYAAVAAVAVGVGVAAIKPASAWGSGYRYGPYAYGSADPYYGSYGYRPSYRHRFHTFNGHRTFYPPGTGG
jgi:hypothetical protein